MSVQTPFMCSLLKLIDWFEQSNQSITDAEGHQVRGVPGWALFAGTSLAPEDASAWTESTGYAGMYPAPCGDDRVAVALEEDEDPGRYRYRCPETFRIKYVMAVDIAVYCVKSSKFLNQIATLLDIPQALRRGIDVPAIDGVLWHLGKTRIGAALVDVWFVRELAKRTSEVLQHFQSSALADQGLILTSGRSLPDFVSSPRQYRIVPLAEVIVERRLPPILDVDLIHRLMAAPAGQTLQKSLPIRFDAYSNTLVIATKSIKPWAIKGKRQVAVVQYLFDQACVGRWWIPAHEILAAVYGVQKLGRSQRIQNIFAGNTVWDDYIGNDGKGRYGFLLD